MTNRKHNKPKSFTLKEQEDILALFRSGKTSREICRQLGWSEGRKSSVNNFLKPYRDVWLNKLDVDVSAKQPRILFWDLESSLMEGYFFRIWKENIPMKRVKKQSHLLSAQWAFNDDEVQGIRVTPEDVKTSNDFDVVVKMCEMINHADLIVTFNGKRFDTKLLSTRALFWGLPPIKPVKHIDLMEQAKRVFKFPSNSMQNISMYLGEDGKLETSGSNLWERCANYENYQQCNNALEEILIYGKQDIVATRDLYRRFQGWFKGVPNLGVLMNHKAETSDLRCIHCGSNDVFKMQTQTYTASSHFDLYRCGEETCRGISRITGNGKNLTGVV